MVNFIKKRLRKWLFSTEELEYEAKSLALRQMKESASIVRLAREQLSGFDPRSISFETLENRNTLSLYNNLSDEETLELINDIHSLYHNRALQIIVDYITRAQVLHGHQDTDSLQGLNFSRATINGLSLLMEQVREGEGHYQQRQKSPDDFDPSKVV